LRGKENYDKYRRSQILVPAVVNKRILAEMMTVRMDLMPS
jgi:hypothetical protein